MRFLDPNVGWISRVPISSGEQDVVPICPISARFYGKEVEEGSSMSGARGHCKNG